MRNKVNLRNNFFFILLFLVFFLFAASLLPFTAVRFSFLSFDGKIGTRLVAPDIFFGAIVATGILYDRKFAAILGLVFGFMCDSFINPPFMLCTLLYFLTGYLAPKLSLIFTQKTPLTMLLVSAPLLLMRSFVSCFNHLASSSRIDLASLFVGALLPEYLYNLFAAIVLFLLINVLFKLFCGSLKR
jgi:hypothetical protein